MSIPIIDINSGDTMSGMVDKINYNFTLLSLKGGGPSGIQGLQGYRGPVGIQGIIGLQGIQGSHIYNLNPSTTSLNGYNIGDVFVWDSNIYQIIAGTSGNTYQQIVNLSVQSPFGVNNHLQEINPHTGYVNYPFVLGADTNNTNSQYQNALFTINANNNSIQFINFYNGNSFIGGIDKTTNNALRLKGGLLDGIVIEGSGNQPHNISIDNNGIHLSGRKNSNISSTSYSTSSFIVSTKLNETDNGIIDNKPENAWGLKNDNINNYSTLFPLKEGNYKSSIGDKISTTNRIDRLCVSNNANIFFDTTSISDYITINADSNGASDSKVLSLSKYGIAIGGLKENPNNGTIYSAFSSDIFNTKITTPTTISTPCGSILSITSIGNNNITSRVSSDLIECLNDNDIIQPSIGIGADWKWRGKILLTETANSNVNKFMLEQYSNLIVSDRKAETGSDKNTNDTLHIHGADSYSKPGCDVVLSGGNNISNNSVYCVGGDVYLSGGSAFKPVGNTVVSDMMRCGNVVIGINPLHHNGCMSSSAYTSTSHEQNNTATNPESVGFFDINNVAIHGNRIVIDSNANLRKITGNYSKTTDATQAEKIWNPYVETPEETTLQLSGVNTISHIDPIFLEQEDICAHQFLSGVMRRIIRFSINNSSITTESINPNEFTNIYVSSNLQSIYFITEQVWQKTGNIVHVNLFGRWLTDAGGRASSDLFHITDHFYTSSFNNLLGGYSNFIDNSLLTSWLLDSDSSQSIGYNYRNSTSDISGLPMTVFRMPISVKNVRPTSCYGNGNIYTEDACTKYGYTSPLTIINPTQSVIQSTPVMIGGYHYPPKSERTIDNERLSGNRTALYKNDFYNTAFHSNENYLAYDFTSTAIGNTDTFRSGGTGTWVESNFTKTETELTNYDYYIQPEMISNFNEEGYGRFYRYSNRVRPCVGMYTWISLDYSYCIMDKFLENNKNPNMYYSSNNSININPTTNQ